MGLFANERQEKIYEMLQKNGAVTTSTLVRTFGVSIETVRRDLLNMEMQNRLLRVHGGAVAKNDMKPFYDLKRRNLECGEQKSELVEKAMEMIGEGDVIGIDAGSTAIFFAEALKKRFSSLTVVTHSIDVFNLLCNHKDFSLILCGGHYLKSENAFYGCLALDMLRTLYIQKAFIFPSAISLGHGIYDYQKELYQIQKQMIRCSNDVFILADSSKFEKKALLKLDDMKTSYTYITDSKLPQELVDLYEENHITLYKGGN